MNSSKKLLKMPVPHAFAETAVSMEYDMWLLPLHHFVELSTLLPHHEMLRQKKLARFNSSMKSIFFLSHQWSSFDHPDPTGEKLRCFQQQLIKMLQGIGASVEPVFADKIYLPNKASVSRAEWKSLLQNGSIYIWMDYFSVPQVCVAASEKHLLDVPRSNPRPLSLFTPRSMVLETTPLRRART